MAGGYVHMAVEHAPASSLFPYRLDDLRNALSDGTSAGCVPQCAARRVRTRVNSCSICASFPFVDALAWIPANHARKRYQRPRRKELQPAAFFGHDDRPLFLQLLRR